MSVTGRFRVWPVIVALILAANVTAGGESKRQEVDELIQALGQRDWQDAVDALVQIGEPAVESLTRKLKDRTVKAWVTHARAVSALAKIGTQQALEAVVESLKDAALNDYVRGSAAVTLGETRLLQAVEPLAEALRDKSQFVRWKSAQALGMLGSEQGASALIMALRDEDQYVRAAAARSLGEIKSASATDALVDALKDESWAVRLTARNALLETGRSAVESLIEALGDKDGRVRWQSAWALGRLKSTEAVEPLLEALEDPDWMIRDEAAVALVRINSKKAAGPLLQAFRQETGHVREQAAWILDRMRSGNTAAEELSRDMIGPKAGPQKIRCGHRSYPCYPETLDAWPDIPSPYTTLDGAEIVTAFMKNGKYALVTVTVENGEPLDYRQSQWGKGRQLAANAGDFPTLAETGLHSEKELSQTKTITGRSTVEITELGRPGRSSGAGFMAHDEDIVSVVRGDNRLVRTLGLRHPQMARPLFHVWNMILRDHELGRLGRFWDGIEHILYNGKEVSLKAEGSKGWQESLFDDEILGTFQLEISRELSQDEETFLNEKYPRLSREQMAELVKRLSHIHTGEMVPYYVTRYGFYEGHTEYRADPIAIALIFGLKSLEQIDAAFEGRLYEALTQHFTRE